MRDWCWLTDWRRRWRFVAAGLLPVLVLLVIPGMASARWGDEFCSLGTRCYNLQNWTMEGGSESIKGVQDVPTTSSMDVQEYSTGAHVTNEIWVSFPEKSGGWFETGQLAGYDNAASCCTLHPFIARTKTASLYGYEEYIWTSVDAEATNLYTIEDASANGDWCTIIWYTNQGCYSDSTYWPPYSTEVEAGIEALQNTQPENSGSQEVDAFTHSGTHIEWKASKTHSKEELINERAETLPSGVMCQTPNYGSNYYGNADWSICG